MRKQLILFYNVLITIIHHGNIIYCVEKQKKIVEELKLIPTSYLFFGRENFHKNNVFCYTNLGKYICCITNTITKIEMSSVG